MTKQISFSDNNHWRFGWGDGLYNFDEQFKPRWVTFGPCTREAKSFDIEMVHTVKRIAEKTTKPIYVAMSGGLDSELIARIMLQEKVPFTPVIVQFDNDLNKHDISYAFDFCKQHNLTPEIIKLDIIAFFKGTLNSPYTLNNCAHLMQMHIMRHVANLGGYCVIGVGEQRYDIENGAVRVGVPLERIAVTHFMQAEQVEGVSSFYTYTPELMLCILREAISHGFEYMSEFAHNIKEDLYRKFWPDLLQRPKHSGFEEMSTRRLNIQAKLRNKWEKKYGVSIFKKYVIPIQTLEDYLVKGPPERP